MKKKILFVIPSLRSGGAEKSLVSLLSVFDYDRYEVHLLSFRRDGLFFDMLDERISEIYDTGLYEVFDGDTKKAVVCFLKNKRPGLAVARILYALFLKIRNPYLREKLAWYEMKKSLPHLSEHYDCVIGYLEQTASMYASGYKNTEKRICYIHSDIVKLKLDKRLCKEIYGKSDGIVTVSDSCRKSFGENYPEYTGKTSVIENIISPELIADAQKNVFDFGNNDGITVLTVGRLSPPKGIDVAVKACRLLKNKNYPVKWYHIGQGECYNDIKSLIRENELDDDFILLGERKNPYPYMAGCDIYVQPSRYEGKSIAIDEVKCLRKPMVVTNYSMVRCQITDGINGLICNIEDEADMAVKIEMLIKDAGLRKKLTENLSREDCSNQSEKEKLYRLIEG